MAVALAATLAWFAAPACAQIVYTHGNDLWVMNDDGSGAHALLTAAQVGGPITDDTTPAVAVQPGGTAVAFDAYVPAADGSCSGNCPGVYSLVNGHLARLSPAPFHACAATPSVRCGSAELSPTVASDGAVVFEHQGYGSAFTCGLYFCGADGAYSDAIEYQPIGGGISASYWALPADTGGLAAREGSEPSCCFVPLSVDPLNSSTLAFTGTTEPATVCAAVPGSPCDPVDVEATSPAITAAQPRFAPGGYQALAFSPNGQLLADVEQTGGASPAGAPPGIWVFPAGQSASGSGPAPVYHWALGDPTSGAPSYSNVIQGVTFAGTGEIVFSADNNLWSISASCWSTPVSGTPAPSCGTFGGAGASVRRLTTDGTTSDPNANPAWTAATTPIAAFSRAVAGTGSGGVVTLTRLTNAELMRHSVSAGKRLGLRATITKAGRISVALLHYVAAVRRGRHRRAAHYQQLELVHFAGRAGLNSLGVPTRVRGHTLPAGRYLVSVAAGGSSAALSCKLIG
jgi:hypothetical protein